MFSARTSAAMAVAAIVGCAGVASASEAKFTTFTCFGVGMVENPDVDGVAKMKFKANRGTTDLTLVLHGLLSNTAYVVFASSDVGGQQFDVTTNQQGKFTLNTDIVGDLASNNPVLILSRGSTDTVSTPVAYSFPN